MEEEIHFVNHQSKVLEIRRTPRDSNALSIAKRRRRDNCQFTLRIALWLATEPAMFFTVTM